ncbi:TPA: serine hydrolase domain-containing protein [Bacillus anthracis]|uniref:serine hydrolase domain-containing protein n=1 Tax=Bacillus anthracis TaxID=1392 RepID=UPI0001DBF289|nr:serine hydrolase domain-containing protein [Bacillus cereus]HDR4496427.1 beta-lactamase family protein [Bacillus cereus biovar anthracis]ADK05610.1 D-alanyl-D-alanine carboxypeptidase [Bacillus cereus biovar anthracis str. CI]HDR6227808.1 beta-lactamase family protein [Bacillus cereus biovar anthracis]HDR6233542.1 beta-lactamase family protein [Bacillus cereus biovar anthracis]HDR6239179.1 beta-lactamase family protein [Bacillus cereus biovar anthracis]
MKKRNSMKLASLAVLLAGTTLITPDFTVKAESTQNISNLSKAHNQKNRNDWKRVMQETVQLGAPGILAKAYNNGKTSSYTAGVADLSTKKPVKSDYRFRIGSVTKTFTATTVLQLVGENRVQLDDSIEKWLPGLIQGNGYDGNQITIRQLLNHTSGIAEYLKSKDADIMNSKKTYTAEEIVKIGLALPPDFSPGKGWSYSNTGYVILGMLIEKITDNSYAEEIEKRIIEPLDLSNTFLPGNSPVIPGKNHARGYVKTEGASELKDITYYNPSLANAAGDMISNADDLNKFFSSLLGGKLLKERELKEMLTTVPVEGKAVGDGYGLGIYETKLPNGVSVWGHGGGIPGFTTFAGGVIGGKHTLAVSINSLDEVDIVSQFNKMMQIEFNK